ncbi:MAG TPA: CAP domain-containing protein [Bacillota bacterium]|jgi:uncharacterized protein YkwD|nr:CAP domain-containing protein [Bacillota bacterium]HOL10580.1 CAP domain-containing protein [Bacillota bacterium]HPO98282.1 CAP domain-containing protein [Bacillota bacterium]
MKLTFKKIIIACNTVTLAVILMATNALAVEAAISNNPSNYRSIKTVSRISHSGSRRLTGSNLEALAILTPEEEVMVKLINQERMEAGLEKLELDVTLIELARCKSTDMVRYNYFGHCSERLGTIYQQLESEKIIYDVVAQNLVGAPNCIKAFQRLMRSPVHRSNILNPNVKKLGIGIIKGGPYGKMITQIFLG